MPCFQTVLCAVLVVSAAGCVEETNFLNPLDYLSSTKPDAAVSDDAAVAGKDAGEAGKGGAGKGGAGSGADAATANDGAAAGPADSSTPGPMDSGTPDTAVPVPDTSVPMLDTSVPDEDSGT